MLTSGCLSIPAACCPTLALSVLAVTISNKSKALSRPVAAKLSISSGASVPDGADDDDGSAMAAEFASPNPPPAAIAPGPAGREEDEAAFFLAPALGAGFFTAATEDSSSARSRAFSALRAWSALRFSSAASRLEASLAPDFQSSASLRS